MMTALRVRTVGPVVVRSKGARGGTGFDGGDAGAGGKAGSSAGAGADGNAGATGDMGGQGAGGPITPASPALPCGAECDAAGYTCVSDECHAPEGAQLWQHRLNERYQDYPGDIASDSAGNAIVGYTTETREPHLANRLYVRKAQAPAIWSPPAMRCSPP